MTDRTDRKWIRLDVGFPHHPKVVALSDAGFRLDVAAMCYAREHLTDGHIPAAWVPSRLSRSVPSLVTAGLWVPADGDGWMIHDYLDWQTSRAEAEDARKRMSEGGRRGAQRRWGTSKGPPWATP